METMMKARKPFGPYWVILDKNKQLVKRTMSETREGSWRRFLTETTIGEQISQGNEYPEVIAEHVHGYRVYPATLFVDTRGNRNDT
jgi:hypothetical protein